MHFMYYVNAFIILMCLFIFVQLVNYGLLRENNPEWWAVNPLELNFIGEADVVSVLPYRNQNQRRTLIYKIGKTTSPCDASVLCTVVRDVASVTATAYGFWFIRKTARSGCIFC